MPTRRTIRCPACGHRYLLDDAASPIEPYPPAARPPDSEDTEPHDTTGQVSLLWLVVVIVASTLGLAVVLATHKNLVGVLAYIVLIAVGWQAWLRSRRTRR